MKKLLILLVLVSFGAHAGTAFLKRQYVSGMNRICIYDHLGSEVAITLRATDICPVTIQI